ncbi:MAG: DUF4139 domain-containing protein [Brevinematales bacterium]|nr:DUF4139 domain-containing protein [Brevinematales bacterium]
MRKFLFLCFFYSLSFGGIAYIYKDVTIIEENILNEPKILIPFNAREITFSKDINIISKVETNIYKESVKEYLREYEENTNEIEKMKKDKKRLEKELENSKRRLDLLEKLLINIPLNQSIKGLEVTLERYYKNFENELKVNNKLKTDIEDIELKIKEKEILSQKLKKILEEKSLRYFLYEFENPMNGLVRYKIYPEWNIRYEFNKDENKMDMNLEFKNSGNIEVGVDKILLINYSYISQNIDKALRPLKSYLAEKYLSKSRIMKSQPAKLMAESTESSEEKNFVQPIESDVGFIFEVNRKLKLTEKFVLPLMTNLTFSTKINYFAIPVKSSWGYYSMTISNTSSIPIIPGKLNLYSKNENFLLDITNTIVENSTYDLSGIEVKEIEATRSIIENFTDMPDLLRNTIINKKTVEIKLKNRLNKSIELAVLDRIPLPSEDRIKLKDVKITDKTDNDIKNIISKDGIVEWKINLKPREEKRIYISYRVEYPKDFNIYESEE